MSSGWPAVVLPVHDGATLLGEALAGFVPAAEALDGRVVVVDDGSSDDSAAVARAAGATVVSLDRSGGPYAARNAGWELAEARGAGVAVFVDVRCRPRPGWLPALLSALDDPGAALAAGEVQVLARDHLAGQATRLLDPLALRHGQKASFLPYAPTCHLAARVRALRSVGGFQVVRGGGDVDLCWRVQLDGIGTIAWAPQAVLDWEPRETVRELLSQYHRYGANTARLYGSFAASGCPVPTPAGPVRSGAHHLRAALLDQSSDGGALLARLVAGTAQLAWDVGYWRAHRAPQPAGGAR